MVIAVIAILAALLLPALQSARQSGRTTVCLSNLREIGSALQQYRIEAERFPNWDYPAGSTLNPWCDLIMGSASEHATWFHWIGIHSSVYVDNKKVFLCPSDEPHPSQINLDRANAPGWAGPFEYSYGIAVPAAAQEGDAAASTYRQWTPHEAAEASAQVLTSEGHWPWQQNFSHQYVYGEPWDRPKWYSSTVSFRHKMGIKGNFMTWAGNAIQRTYKQLEDNKEGSSSTQEIFFHHRGENPQTQYY